MILLSRRCLPPPQKLLSQCLSVTGRREKRAEGGGGGGGGVGVCACVCVCVWGRGRGISRVAFSSPLLAQLFLLCSISSLL